MSFIQNQIQHPMTEMREDESIKSTELEKLVEKAINGDRDALCSLCENVAKSILFRTKYVLNNEADAEDVTQEVLIRTCENIRSLRSPKAFNAWLGGIIINESNRHLSRNSKKETVDDISFYTDVFVDENEDSMLQERYEKNESRTELMSILEQLPIRQREAVVLRYYSDMSIAEVADAMKISKQSATKYLSLARDKLKIMIEQEPAMAKMANFGTMAAVPIGILMADTLKTQAALFTPANAAWLPNTLAVCQQGIYAQSASYAIASEAASKIRKTKRAVTCAVAAACVICAVGAGMVIGGDVQESPEVFEQVYETGIEGSILFTGCEFSENPVHVNPQRAEPQVHASEGTVTVQEWWIEDVEGIRVLDNSDGAVVEDALAQMKAIGDIGEYRIQFKLKNGAGAIYVLSSNFFIIDS